MALRSNLKWVIAAALIANAATPAGAQPAGAPAGASAAPQSDGHVGDAQVGFQRNAQLSPQEQLAEGDRIVGRMDSAASAVRKQLQQAREARDVVKTLCLNDKLSQIDVAIRSARDRRASLQNAASRNDRELSNHEFTILTVLRQRAEQLTAEANQCIGEEAAFIGQTQVLTTVDPSLPPSDDTQFPSSEPPIVPIPPPQCTSCSL